MVSRRYGNDSLVFLICQQMVPGFQLETEATSLSAQLYTERHILEKTSFKLFPSKCALTLYLAFADPDILTALFFKSNVDSSSFKKNFPSSIFFFFFFGTWKFLSQESNSHHSCDLNCHSDNARSLTLCAPSSTLIHLRHLIRPKHLLLI